MSDWENDINRYRNHEMTPEEEYALEKRALSDPFLSEALEGISLLSPGEFSGDMADIQHKIYKKTRSNRWQWPLRIAASIVLLTLVYFAVAPLLKNSTNQLALQNPKVTLQPSQTPVLQSDSITTTKLKQESLNQPSISAKESSGITEKTKIDKEISSHQPTLAAAPEIKEQATNKINDDTLSQSLAEKEARAIEEDEILRSKVQVAQLENSRRKNLSINSSQRLVQGKVLAAEDATPIPGVNVIIKGTQTGTTTDLNGDYKILMDSTQSNLVFSFIGLQTQEIAVANQSDLIIKLQPDVSQLSEVVVTGYSAFAPVDGREPIIKLAEPAGGRKAYDKYLDNSLHYPPLALENKIKGRVTIQFIVRTDGSLDEFNVLKGLGFGCDEEVIRLVKEGPRWSPTTEDNVPIESEVRVRVKFALPN